MTDKEMLTRLEKVWSEIDFFVEFRDFEELKPVRTSIGEILGSLRTRLGIKLV